MLPSIWRVELLHPLSIHFPIALLILGSIFYALSCVFGRIQIFRNLRNTAFILIFIGTISAWIAIFTGSLAEEVVGSTLCNPDIRLSHEDFSYYTAYIFTSVIILELLGKRLTQRLVLIFTVLNLILVIAGSGLLGYVSHLGATLVYQQAAGVYDPGPQCNGY